MKSQHQNTIEKLKVIAREPFGIYYEGVADVVSAANKVGQFDILPGHADFFSILESGDVIIDNEATPTVINIKNGIITVQNNEVLLFLNI
jgi:F0F1-type ATP synthase epsilon subunit